MTGRRIGLGMVAALVVAVAVVGVTASKGGASSSTARREADAFLLAWRRGDTAAMAATLDAPPSDLASLVGSPARSAPGTTISVHTTGVNANGSQGTAKYHARLAVAGLGPFDWDGQLSLVKVQGGWRVHWTPADLFPGLTEGQRIVVHKTWPTRAPILGADGSALVSTQPGVSVGLEPDHITDLDEVKATLSQLLGVDPTAVDRALAGPGVQPSYFVPIITLRTDNYNVLRPQLAGAGNRVPTRQRAVRGRRQLRGSCPRRCR